MSVEQFIKGSVWATVTPIKVRGADIPVGTKFEVVYPRRRESNLVACKFLDPIAFPKRQNRHTSVVSRPRRGTKGRFHKADELISAARLEGAQIVSLPASPLEYFIRKVETNEIYCGGHERPSAFYDLPFSEGNHFVSADNARIGIVTMLFKKYYKSKAKEGTPPWEIVGYDPFANEVLEVHAVSETWWNNIVRMARWSRTLPQPDPLDPQPPRGQSTPAQRVRKLANLIVDDGRQWGYVAMMADNLSPKILKAKWQEKMSNAGITELLSVDDNTFMMVHDTDRVMMKLLFAADVETLSLV
jgi:hypothetical protein